MVAPDETSPELSRVRHGVGRTHGDSARAPRLEAAATPAELRERVLRLRRWSVGHFFLAVFFAIGAAITYWERPSTPRRRVDFAGRTEQFADDITHWEIIVASAGISIVNLTLGEAKRRRAGRLAIDPDADHPEAKVFE